MEYIKNSGTNFDGLTKNEDGVVIALNILYYGYRYAMQSDDLWPHQSTLGKLGELDNGIKFNSYQMTDIGDTSLNITPSIGTIIHENGHLLGGWFDTYDKNFPKSNALGKYDLMCWQDEKNPQPPNPFFRYISDWEELNELTPSKSGNYLSLDMRNTNECYLYYNYLNTKSYEFFMIERTKKTGRRSKYPSEGLFIWHIDTTGSNNNEQMTPKKHYNISFEQADGKFDLEKINGNGNNGDAFNRPEALGKGVNFGNLLDAYPEEGSWSNDRVIMESDFDLAVEAGFDSVRIPIRFSNYALFDSPYTIDEVFMTRVDEVIDWGLSKGLKIIIVMHHYRNDENPDDLYNDINKYPNENKDRFISMWKQIAARYSNYSENLYYELLNEPNTNLTVDIWNDILADCINGIREVDNFHTIVVDCANWSNISGLNGLQIPNDERNAIVTFHYYTPILFCNQGMTWSGSDCANTTGIVWPRTPEIQVTPGDGVSQWVIDWINNYNTIEDDDINPGGHGVITREIQEAANWGIVNNRPLWMSEFTAHSGADFDSRVRWIEFVRTELESNNITWSYWSQFSDDCYLYDNTTGNWVIELTQALGLTVSN